MNRWGHLLVAMAWGCLLFACDRRGSSSTEASSAPTVSARASSASAQKAQLVEQRSGGSIARRADGSLLVADEDRGVLWALAAPVSETSSPQRIDLPGPPSQVLPLGAVTLVTIRAPSLLLVLDEALHEVRRTPLPADAWGLAVTPDGTTAIVTSAWSHQVSGVDVATGERRFSLDVAREPRGIVVPAAGDRVYVSHLVGTALTRIDLSPGAPRATAVELPAAPARVADDPVAASLGYAAVLSPDDRRLFLPRHALGALGDWWGAATVDVLLTGSDQPLAPARANGPITRYRPIDPHSFDDRYVASPAVDSTAGAIAPGYALPFAQPRAVVYRKRTQTLLVASEGTDELAELDALAVTPAELRIKRYRLGAGYDSGVTIASSGGAPSGIALSADETTAFVFCRATFEVAIVPLVALERHVEPAAVKMVKLAEEDPLLAGMAKTDPKRAFREAAAFGRRLYFGALATEIGEHLGCAGCHPDGRDDGNVWLEIDHESTEPVQVGSLGAVKNRLHQLKDSDFRARQKLVVGVPRARQTPMLAGRVFADGPSGWRGESDGLVARIGRGFALHRWEPYTAGTGLEGHARALAAFVLRGLPPPERSKAPLSPIAERGRALFESDAVGCKSCHPLVEDKNLGTTSLHFPPTRAGHASEMAEPFRIPSLRFVGGTPPYFHDGSATTLAALVAMTKNHMGRTAQLEDDDRAALVAFLETL